MYAVYLGKSRVSEEEEEHGGNDLNIDKFVSPADSTSVSAANIPERDFNHDGFHPLIDQSFITKVDSVLGVKSWLKPGCMFACPCPSSAY